MTDTTARPDDAAPDELPGDVAEGVEKAGLLPEFRFHDLRYTGNTWAAGSGANLRELMERMGHSSTRAALTYLHASRSGDRRIADGIGRHMTGEGGDQVTTATTMAAPECQLGSDLARNWHDGRSGAQSLRPPGRSA